MILNISDYKNRATKYDVAIIGAGVAGIILALELEASGLKAVLVESGDFDLVQRTQDLYKGRVEGKFLHAPLDTYRMRFFGGSSNCWGGGCLPYDEIDFQERTYLPRSGWPIKYSDLIPYYKRACGYVEIDTFEFDANESEIIAGISRTGILNTKHWKKAKEAPRFNKKYRNFFETSKSTDLIINANLVRLTKRSESQEIQAAFFKSFEEIEIKIEATYFILSAGGIENARILLNSSAIFNEAALQKTYANVGKFYSPHINITHGTFVPAPGTVVLDDYEDISQNMQIKRFLAPSNSAMNQFELLNCKSTFEGFENLAAPLADEIFLYLYDRNLLDDEGSQIEIYRDLLKSGAPDDIKKRLGIKGRKAYVLNHAFEQEPNWNSKVELIDDIDNFSMKKVRLFFDVKNSDIQRSLKYFDLISKTVGELGLGRFSYDHSGEIFYTQELGASHHTGTTRMSIDYKNGVVDTNCKVHGISNLFISSASVFPTPGHANPTFTIAAMSIRLADFLKRSSTLKIFNG